jgi:hypothetical protein
MHHTYGQSNNIGISEMKAAQKASDRIHSMTEDSEIKSDDKYLFIKSEYKILKIDLDDIKYIESMREYLRIHNRKPNASYGSDEYEKNGAVSS